MPVIQDVHLNIPGLMPAIIRADSLTISTGLPSSALYMRKKGLKSPSGKQRPMKGTLEIKYRFIIFNLPQPSFKVIFFHIYPVIIDILNTKVNIKF